MCSRTEPQPKYIRVKTIKGIKKVSERREDIKSVQWLKSRYGIIAYTRGEKHVAVAGAHAFTA